MLRLRSESNNNAEGFMHGVPPVIEADIVIRDKKHILLEVKSRINRGDFHELNRVGKLYEKVIDIKPRLAILGVFIDRNDGEVRSIKVEVILITPQHKD